MEFTAPSFIIGGDSSEDSDSDESSTGKVSVEVQTDKCFFTQQNNDTDEVTSEPRSLEECVAVMKSEVSLIFGLIFCEGHGQLFLCWSRFSECCKDKRIACVL